jgi:DNA-binding LytR/AlgR family response regulator
MIQPKKESIDETIDTMQDQIMNLSKEIVERECRETYINTMKDIIHCLMYDLHRTELESCYSDKLKNNYGIKPKDQERLKKAFKQCFNDNFDQIWGKSNDTAKETSE